MRKREPPIVLQHLQGPDQHDDGLLQLSGESYPVSRPAVPDKPGADVHVGLLSNGPAGHQLR